MYYHTTVRFAVFTACVLATLSTVTAIPTPQTVSVTQILKELEYNQHLEGEELKKREPSYQVHSCFVTRMRRELMTLSALQS